MTMAIMAYVISRRTLAEMIVKYTNSTAAGLHFFWKLYSRL